MKVLPLRWKILQEELNIFLKDCKKNAVLECIATMQNLAIRHSLDRLATKIVAILFLSYFGGIHKALLARISSC